MAASSTTENAEGHPLTRCKVAAAAFAGAASLCILEVDKFLCPSIEAELVVDGLPHIDAASEEDKGVKGVPL